MPQMSPSMWSILSIFETMMFVILISKIYFISLNLKINFPLKTFKYKMFNWKWK